MHRREQGRAMDFTVEFFRMRPSDRAHATLDRVAQTAPDFDLAKVRALSLFESLDMPQRPDGLKNPGQHRIRGIHLDAPSP